MVSNIRIWLGVSLGVLTSVILSLDGSFNVYAIALKKAFNFTQTEVELISAAGVAGFGGSIYDSLIARKFGYKIGYIAAFVVNTGAVTLLWLTVIYSNIFHNFPGVIAALHFLIGAGACGCNSKLSSIAINNLSPKHTGKVIGVSFAASAISCCFYAALLTLLSEDLERFFLVAAVLYATGIGACFCFHRPVAKDENSYHLIEGNQIDNGNGDVSSFAETVNSALFHLTFWPSVIEFSVVTTFFNNITSMAQSFGSDEPIYIVYVVSATVTVGRIVLGYIFDSFMTYFCGVFIMLLTGGLTVVGIILLLIWFNFISLHIFSVLLGIGFSSALTVPCTVMSVAFGRSHFVYFTGAFFVFSALFCLLFQYLVGYLYDLHLAEDGFCYGSHCFYRSSVILLVISGIMAGIHLIDIIRYSRMK